MTMYVCGARTLAAKGGWRDDGEREADGIEIKVLERHPFTTQTFIPLTADGTKRYLVVVAPTLDAASEDEDLPVPDREEAAGLPGPGLPDLLRLTAFVATGEQAVTYGAGTWHAPMIALGPPYSTVDFVVVQFANDVPVEDCQEVAIEGGDAKDGAEAARIWVRVSEEKRETERGFADL